MSEYRNKRHDVWSYIQQDTGRKLYYIVKSINPFGRDSIHQVIYDCLNDSCHCDCEYFGIHGEKKDSVLDCSHVNEVRKKLKQTKEENIK